MKVRNLQIFEEFQVLYTGFIIWEKKKYIYIYIYIGPFSFSALNH